MDAVPERAGREARLMASTNSFVVHLSISKWWIWRVRAALFVTKIGVVWFNKLAANPVVRVRG